MEILVLLEKKCLNMIELKKKEKSMIDRNYEGKKLHITVELEREKCQC